MQKTITIKALCLRYIVVRKRLFIIAAAMFLAVSKVCAQYDVSFSHYWDMEPYFNPGSVGKEEKLSVVGAYALDFVGFENNPKTMYLGADMPIFFLKNYHGVGVSMLNDQIGLFTHQRIALQYAFKHKLFGGVISAGLQVGLILEGFKGSDLDLEDSGDPAFSSSDINGNSFDLAFGLYYTHGRWYVGLSAQHLNAPLIDMGETNELQVDRTYYLTGGYNIRLRNPFLTIHPSVLVRTDGVAYRGDVSARLQYTNEKKMLYVGLSYSPTNSVTVLIGGSFHGINVGYSYEMYTSAISLGNGSHELFAQYQMNLDLVKKGKNKHKSVRIL